MKKDKFYNKLNKIILLHLTKTSCDEVWLSTRIKELVIKNLKENEYERKTTSRTETN